MDIPIIQVLAAAALTFVITLLITPVVRKFAHLRDYLDRPDNNRKLHVRDVATMGGIGIFFAYYIGFTLSGYAGEMVGFPYFSAALLFLFFTGMKDDISEISVKFKLLIEIIVASIVIIACEVSITNFYGVFGIHEISVWMGRLITLFTIIVVMNAFNLIDGVDGLAAGLGCIATLLFGIGFWMAGDGVYMSFALILCAALFAFLMFNFSPASIILGDTGSLITGFLIAILAVQFVGLNESVSFTEQFGEMSPILPIAILSVPLYDTFRVFLLRMFQGKSPFTPGYDHIHHVVLRIGFDHKRTAVFLYIISILITLIAYVSKSLEINTVLGIILISMILLLPTNGYKRRLLLLIGIDVEKRIRK